MSAVMVAGSAHLDILSHASSRDDVIDRIGQVSIEVGGTACNIAINLAHAGVDVRFLTAMNDSAYSTVITDYLVSMGVDPHLETIKNLPTGAFSAHIDTHGELVSAVSSMPVEQVNFEEERIRTALDGAVAAILDCNLSPQALSRLVAIANDLDVPVYVAAVSQEKSVRIGSIAGRIKGIFINEKEFRFFCRAVFGCVKTPAAAAVALQSAIMMTNGAAGSTLALPDGTPFQIPPSVIGEKGSRLGMGDAMAAGVVLLHEVQGRTMPEAANDALRMVSWVGASEHCHPGQIGALETAIERVHHHAEHDAMTGVLNRHSTERVLSRALEKHRKGQSKALSALIIDIDLFKSVNDTYGHNVGDEVIKEVAKVAQSCLRGTDFLGRWGGEEFIVVLPDTPLDQARFVAERIRQSIEEKVLHPRPVTASIGCGTASETTCTIDTVVEMADKALYEAKRAGRNRVI